MSYNTSNIFAEIIRGNIPCDKVYEDDYILAFHDINKAANLHILVLPKGNYTSFDDFATHADETTIAHFFRTTRKIAKEYGLVETGYRIVANHGSDASQTVPHFHLHILGKQKLGSFGSHNTTSHK